MSGGPLTLGTAGHIDHGKTALIEALTGVDTDRLPEEKERGISIALGYAPLRTRTGRPLSIIDVPGHERFVRTMVAGASGIDFFLMVVAADDGVMPQTIEHATVLRALDVRSGIVAITKVDVADPQVAMAEARELFPDSEHVACSSRTGEGIDALHDAIERMGAKLSSRAAGRGEPVLHIDRSFTLRGQGTIVTGTLLSGEISRGDTLSLLPAEVLVRVRGLQVHDEPTSRAEAGQRVAVNLSGIRVREVDRGDVLSAPGLLRETTTLDCALRMREAEHNERVHVHHGTREAPGRLALLAEDLWQVRLSRPVFAADGDRLVIRRSSPPDTLGGGIVLDAHAQRHGRRPEILDRLRRRRDGIPEPAPVESAPARPEPVPTPEVPEVDAAELGELERALAESWLRPLTAAQLEASPGALAALCERGEAVRLGGKLYIHARALAEARDRTVRILERDDEVTLSRLRDELGVSRKSAQALLEHFDSTRVTHRLPDDRRVPSVQLRREQGRT
ncbi:MAG: selenocysteine-specific translation elongation factor [Solirubrobacterales bacterium]